MWTGESHNTRRCSGGWLKGAIGLLPNCYAIARRWNIDDHEKRLAEGSINYDLFEVCEHSIGYRAASFVLGPRKCTEGSVRAQLMETRPLVYGLQIGERSPDTCVAQTLGNTGASPASLWPRMSEVLGLRTAYRWDPFITMC